MAEAHPVGFQWVMEAKARGAKLIHVDPRYSRTSAVADLHVPIRAGADIAFVGGLINYVLQNEKYFRDYVVAYTSYTASHRTDELALLRQLAAHPLVNVRIAPIEEGRGHVVYRVTRPGCPGGSSPSS